MNFKFDVGDTVKIVAYYNEGRVDTDALRYNGAITTITKRTNLYEHPSYMLKGFESPYPNDPILGHIERYWEEGLLERV